MDPHPAELVLHMLKSPFTSQSRQPYSSLHQTLIMLGSPLILGTAPTRGLPNPALTDWPMVMPSIFRAGTCFMGFSAWNSLENCGEKALWAGRPGLSWLKQNKASRKTPGPLLTPEPPRPNVIPGQSIQYPNPQWPLSYRLHPSGLAICALHCGHQDTRRGPSME